MVRKTSIDRYRNGQIGLGWMNRFGSVTDFGKRLLNVKRPSFRRLQLSEVDIFYREAGDPQKPARDPSPLRLSSLQPHVSQPDFGIGE